MLVGLHCNWNSKMSMEQSKNCLIFIPDGCNQLNNTIVFKVRHAKFTMLMQKHELCVWQAHLLVDIGHVIDVYALASTYQKMFGKIWMYNINVWMSILLHKHDIIILSEYPSCNTNMTLILSKCQSWNTNMTPILSKHSSCMAWHSWG